MAVKRIGVFTGGGDCPGLNAVIRGVVHRSVREHGIEVIGSYDSFNGYFETPQRVKRLDIDDCKGLVAKGGTMLGTTNRGDPFDYPVEKDGKIVAKDRSAELAEMIRAEGIDGLVAIGGDGTLGIAKRLMDEHGIPFVGVPKTIDNDVGATDYTFGFWTAVQTATDAIDRLHTTAESHDRIMVVELMGRDAGHIALAAGIAGGADCILIPEIPFDIEKVASKILRRQKKRRQFSLVAVAEGARPVDGQVSVLTQRPEDEVGGQVRLGGLAQRVSDLLAQKCKMESRYVVLGHLQRGGTPIAFDRALATAYGVKAADCAAAGNWGQMVCLRTPDIVTVPIDEGIDSLRQVNLTGTWIEAARGVGICLGDQ